MIAQVKSFLFKGWLIESLLLTILTISATLTISYVADSLYKVSFGEKTFTKANLTLVDQNGSKSSENTNTTQNNSGSTSTTNSSTSNTQTSSGTTPTTTSGGTQPTTPPVTTQPPPTQPPPSQPPPSPPPDPTGCFVTVNGYLYNMQSAVGKSLTDPNTGKSRTHSSSTFHCGTYSAPTNMTSTYLSKHNGLGCAPRLAPYIYTPPAPTDPTC